MATDEFGCAQNVEVPLFRGVLFSYRLQTSTTSPKVQRFEISAKFET